MKNEKSEIKWKTRNEKWEVPSSVLFIGLKWKLKIGIELTVFSENRYTGKKEKKEKKERKKINKWMNNQIVT